VRALKLGLVLAVAAVSAAACTFNPRLNGFSEYDTAADREWDRKTRANGGRYPVYDPDAAQPVYVIRRR
jgi:hypothetical protein